jgi:hypothetical protein
MDLTQFVLILCATIFIGVGIPAGLYFMFRRDNRAELIQIMQKTSREMRQPFKRDQEQMDELARRVAELKEKEENIRLELSKQKESSED